MSYSYSIDEFNPIYYSNNQTNGKLEELYLSTYQKLENSMPLDRDESLTVVNTFLVGILGDRTDLMEIIGLPDASLRDQLAEPYRTIMNNLSEVEKSGNKILEHCTYGYRNAKTKETAQKYRTLIVKLFSGNFDFNEDEMSVISDYQKLRFLNEGV